MNNELCNQARIPTETDILAMSKRTTIVLPDKVFADLEKWADEEGRPTANLAAFLVEQAIRAKYPSEYPSPSKKDKGVT
jgi:CopG-like RHH_1 or ribbon-helix-helix domain, RHH_5